MSRNTKVVLACALLFSIGVLIAWRLLGSAGPIPRLSDPTPAGVGEAHRALSNQPSDGGMAPGSGFATPAPDAPSAAAEGAN